MKANLIIAILAVATQLFGSACGPSEPSVKGNSNWLAACTEDAECDSGNCLCGTCTWSCDTDTQCDGSASGDAVCVAPAMRGIASDCADTPNDEVDALCFLACEDEGDCARGFRCLQGACVHTSALTAVGTLDGPCSASQSCDGELMCDADRVCTPADTGLLMDNGAVAPLPTGQVPACRGDESVALISETQTWMEDRFSAPARGCMVLQGPPGLSVGCSENRSLTGNDLRTTTCPDGGAATVEVFSEDEKLVRREYSCEFLLSGQRDVFEYTTHAGTRYRHTYSGAESCNDFRP